MNLRRVTILGGAFALTAAICGLVFWITNGERAANRASSQFAGALVRSDAAPDGARRYVDGVRSHFEGVSAARVIASRNHRVSRGRNGRTFHITDVHVQTATGPAVLELEFDSTNLLDNSEKITRVVELFPRDVPDDALSDPEFEALAVAFERRGGRPASNLQLSGAIVKTPDMVKTLPQRVSALTPVITPPPVTRQEREAKRRLRCIQKASGDVEKMAACAN
jgi:hypothetical protein